MESVSYIITLSCKFDLQMKQYLLNIKIGDKEILPIKIYDGHESCKASSMKTLSCLVGLLQSRLDVPVVFEYIEDCDGDVKSICKESITLHRQRNFITTVVNRMLGGYIKEQISIEIFFNDSKEGLCIGFLSSKLKPARYLVNDDYRGGEQVEVAPSASNVLSAKEIFISNFAVFSDLLMLTREIDNEWGLKWEQVIASIPNSSDLQIEFSKYKDKLETWIKLLQSWGLKKDGCKQYPGILVDLKRYDIVDNEQLYENANYIVVSPCWTMWIESDGIKTEKIVFKGLIKQK